MQMTPPSKVPTSPICSSPESFDAGFYDGDLLILPSATSDAMASHSSSGVTVGGHVNSILMATLTEQLDKYNDSMYNFHPMRPAVAPDENFLEGLDSDAGISLADLDSITLLPLAANNNCHGSSHNNSAGAFGDSEAFIGWSSQEPLSSATSTFVTTVDMTPSPASYSSSPAFSWETSSNNDFLGSPAGVACAAPAAAVLSNFDVYFQQQLQQQQQSMGEFFLPEMDYNDVMDRSLAKFVGDQ
jgi:hypothetical protein